MSDPDALVKQLRRSNRVWKALALTAWFVLLLMGIMSYMNAERERIRTELALRHAREALASVQKPTNSVMPR
jgi:hypothetical protein